MITVNKPFPFVQKVIQLSAVDLIVAQPYMQRSIGLVPVLYEGKEIGGGELIQSRLSLAAEQCVSFAGSSLTERKAYRRAPASTNHSTLMSLTGLNLTCRQVKIS